MSEDYQAPSGAGHPITPPPELVRQWMERTEYDEHTWFYESYIAEQAARWGADKELEACVDVLGGQWEWDVLSQCTSWKEFRDQSEEILRAARRPKPLSLKEQALAVIENSTICDHLSPEHQSILRRALEQLDDWQSPQHASLHPPDRRSWLAGRRWP